MTTNNKIKVTLMLSPEAVEKLDSIRGDLTKSMFFEVLLKKGTLTNDDVIRLILNIMHPVERDEKTKNGDE